MIIVLGSIQSTPDRFKKLIEMSQQHARNSRRESGNISYDIHANTEIENRMAFTEEWEDMASLQRHVEASQGFIKELSKVITQAPEIRVFESNQLDFGG